MLKNLFIFTLIFFSLLGCSKECELTVYNDTPIQQTVKINGTIYVISANDPPVKEIFYLNSYLLWNESVKVPIEYVANSATAYRSPKTFTVEMKPSKDKTYHVKYDRGCIQFRNLSSVRIYQILYRAEGDDEWSENILTSFIYPDEIHTIAFKEDTYYIRFIDDFGLEYPTAIHEIVAGETLMHIFEGEL